MKAKTKKLTYLTAGLTGALAASAVVGTALSSCTVTASNNTNSNITLPDTWYNKDINWNDSTSLNNLLIDDQGIVYSNKYMTEIIAILPGYGGSTITIPASVKTISGYYNVTTNSSNETVKTATGAFEGLTSLTDIIFAGNKVTQIGAKAFYGCTSLKSINLPSSVTLIADDAFNGCTSLNSVNLNNIQYIGARAFNNSFSNVPYGSVSLNLNSTSFIGDSAFSGATGIKSVDLSKNSTLTSIGASAFANCAYLTGAINISNDKYLVTIGNSAFSGCTSITNVYLSDSVSLKTIGDTAFSGCTSLVSIGTNGTTSGFIVPSTVTSIGASAFANTLISRIDLSQNTATDPLKSSALKDMTELSSIDLGTSITTLNQDLFDNTPKLKDFDLVLPASITSIYGGNGSNVGGSGYIPSTYSAFYNSGFKSIDFSKIAGQLIYVDYCLFENATNLEKVVLKSTTTQIRFRAFYGCTSLKTVVFADSDGNVSNTATGFVAPATLTTIGSFAFYNTGLESIDLSAVTSSSIMGTESTATDYTNTTNRFAYNQNLTSVKLPATTVVISSGNFYNTPKLNSVNFDQLTNLTTINAYNFSNSALTDIDLSSTKLSSISATNTFASLTNEATVKLPATLTSSVSSSSFTYSKTGTDGTTTTVALPLTYPKGFGATTTLYSNKILSASSGNSFSFLSRISGALDFSNFTNLNGIGQYTAFGGSSISSLKFAASSFASGTFNTTTPSSGKYTYLGFIGTGITSANTVNTTNPNTYATANLPFGNMSKLDTITFDSFTNATASDDSSSSSSTSVMAKTTSETWDEVARIINSFAKSSVDESNDTSSYVANLSNWDDVANNVTAEITYDESVTPNVVKSVTLTTKQTSSGASNTITINDSSNSGSIEYSGVTWTLALDASKGTITLTSSANVDTYRTVVAKTTGSVTDYPGPGYKVFFNTTTKQITSSDSSATNVVVPDSAITVTLNVVTSSTN